MEYVVGYGESLWSIAEKTFGHGQRWTEIARLNKLSTSRLFVGQHLYIPPIKSQVQVSQVKSALLQKTQVVPGAHHHQAKTVPARGFFFVLADEVNPFTKKLVRKVVLPDHGNPQVIQRLMHPERYGFTPRDPASPVSLGRHVLGRTDSKFISASERPLGSPRFPGKRYFIDAKKVEQSGAKIHDGSAIAKDLDRIAAKTKKSEFRQYIEEIKEKSLVADREAIIEGEVPAAAVKGAGSMALTRGLQIVQGAGIILTAYDIGKAADQSIKTGNAAALERETIRQTGGWVGSAGGRVIATQGVKLASRWAVAMADAEIGGEAGAVLGIETGPGAIVTGLVGGLIGGIIGFVMADAAADLLVPNGGGDVQ